MEINFHWDDDRSFCEIVYKDVQLFTSEDIQQWRGLILTELGDKWVKTNHKKFGLVVCIDGLQLDPAVGPEYSKLVLEVAQRYCIGIARYGQRAMVRAVVAAEATRRVTSGEAATVARANIFDRREDAVDFVLNSMKRHADEC